MTPSWLHWNLRVVYINHVSYLQQIQVLAGNLQYQRKITFRITKWSASKVILIKFDKPDISIDKVFFFLLLFVFCSLSTVILTLCSCHMVHQKGHAQNNLCEFSVYLREIINMFLVSQMSGLVENFKTGIFSDTLIAVNVKLCKMVLLVELYLFTPLSVTLTILQC